MILFLGHVQPPRKNILDLVQWPLHSVESSPQWILSSFEKIWWWIAWLHHNSCFFLCNSGLTCTQGMRNSATVKMLEVEACTLLLKDTFWKGWVLFEDVEKFIITLVEGRAKSTQITVTQFSKCLEIQDGFCTYHHSCYITSVAASGERHEYNWMCLLLPHFSLLTNTGVCNGHWTVHLTVCKFAELLVLKLAFICQSEGTGHRDHVVSQVFVADHSEKYLC